MYSVSQAYKTLMASGNIQTKLTFTIGEDEYTEENILAGSFQVTNQCTDTKDITLGAVYVGQLTATLRNVNITRNNWRDKVIVPTFSVLIDADEDEWEDVPLGVFTITEATWKSSGVSIKAYDNMAKFDKALSLNQSGGYLYDFLVVACTDCGVTLGMTEAQVQALPNGLQYFSYYSEVEVDTWRDLLSWIAQTMGGYATINRAGELEIRTYGTTSVDTLGRANRHVNGSFSDYITKYTMLSYVSLAEKTTKIIAADPNNGTLMSLGTNPFLQTKSQAVPAAQNILTAIGNICYNPFKINTISNPAYDLGDVITFTGGIAGTTATCCLQKYVFKLHNRFEMSGYGADPNGAAARSKTEKEINNLATSASLSAMGFYEYRNVSEIVADNQRKQVVRIKIVTNVATRVHIHCNINLETEADDAITEVMATYIIDGTEQTLHPQETYIDGKHVLHLMYVLPMSANQTSHFFVYLDAINGAYTIEREGAWAYASGVGLVGDGIWDGEIECYDESVDITVDVTMTVQACTETISVATQVPVGGTLTDTAVVLTMPEVAYIESLTDSVSIINHGGADVRVLEDTDIRYTEDGELRMTEEEAS